MKVSPLELAFEVEKPNNTQQSSIAVFLLDKHSFICPYSPDYQSQSFTCCKWTVNSEKVFGRCLTKILFDPFFNSKECLLFQRLITSSGFLICYVFQSIMEMKASFDHQFTIKLETLINWIHVSSGMSIHL